VIDAFSGGVQLPKTSIRSFPSCTSSNNASLVEMSPMPPQFESEPIVSPMRLAIVLVAGTVGALLVLVFRFAESHATMRGRNGKPLPAWVERALRLFFLAVIAGPLTFMVDYFFFQWPVLTMLCVLYSIPYSDLSEQNGGKNPRLRKCLMWGMMRSYFWLELVRTCPLDPTKQYIFAIHPHGILPFGSTAAMCSEHKGGFNDLFPGINFKTLVATFGFYIPLYRELMLYTGMVDASRFSAKKLLDEKMSIALVPGGATEALYVSPDKDVLFLKKRKGFIKLALEHGAQLVPVYSFNENRTYLLYQGGNKFFNQFRKHFKNLFGLTLPLVLNIVPRRTKITLVVGQPISMPFIKDPSPAEVDKHLSLYIGKLRELYEANKNKYNEPKNKELVII